MRSNAVPVKLSRQYEKVEDQYWRLYSTSFLSKIDKIMYQPVVEEFHTYHRAFKPGIGLPSDNDGVKGEIDDPVANGLVELKVGPAPRFSTGKVSGVFGLSTGYNGVQGENKKPLLV